MGKSVASRFAHIDIERSVLEAVIIDDDEVMLEMDFCLDPAHPKYEEPGDGEACCFQPGVLRFAGISKLTLDRGEVSSGSKRRFAIHSCKIEGAKFDMACEWGIIHLQARSIRVLTD